MWLGFLFGLGVLLVIVVAWFAVAYWLNPDIDSPDGKARITGTCGDTMEMCLKFQKGKVVDSSHWTDGCVYSFNCVCAAADLAKGKSPEELLDIDANMIQQAIGGLPRDHLHCAILAAQTLHAAVDDYMQKGVTRPAPHVLQ